MIHGPDRIHEVLIIELFKGLLRETLSMIIIWSQRMSLPLTLDLSNSFNWL